jgi:hypothetical protein
MAITNHVILESVVRPNTLEPKVIYFGEINERLRGAAGRT